MPAQRRRTQPQERQKAPFGTTREHRMGGTSKIELPMSIACERALAQLAAFGATYPLISSTVELRRDGLPRSDRVEPPAPGAPRSEQRPGGKACGNSVELTGAA